MKHFPQHQPAVSRRKALTAVVGALATLTGCGGGGGSIAGLSSGGTGSFTGGIVTGLGSIIVNGIRYDDSAAQLLARDDGSAFAGPLRVGMVVSVQGSAIVPAVGTTALPTATAFRISVGSEWLGPVQAVDTVNNTLTVFGATIDVLTSTVFAGTAARLADIVANRDTVEVYGYVDTASGHLQASRIEVGATAPSSYRFSGVIGAFDPNAQTFVIGGLTLAFGSAAVVPATAWGTGSFVRVTLGAAPVGATAVATAVRLVASPFAALATGNADEAELHGVINAFTSATQFSVNGVAVDARQASVSGVPALGVDVEVEGPVVGGVIVASSVKTRTTSQIEAQSFEFYGAVSALDTTARTFVLRGYSFQYTGTTVIDVTPWVTGATPYVKVEATLVNGAWVATEIQNGS